MQNGLSKWFQALRVVHLTNSKTGGWGTRVQHDTQNTFRSLTLGGAAER